MASPSRGSQGGAKCVLVTTKSGERKAEWSWKPSEKAQRRSAMSQDMPMGWKWCVGQLMGMWMPPLSCSLRALFIHMRCGWGTFSLLTEIVVGMTCAGMSGKPRNWLRDQAAPRNQSVAVNQMPLLKTARAPSPAAPAS